MLVFEKVYQVVKKIPPGRVVTYGQVARVVGTTPRVVGFALHANPYDRVQGKLYVPCHRVVDRTGRLAAHFAFGGAKEQRLRLKSEGIRFEDEMHVDLAQAGVDIKW